MKNKLHQKEKFTQSKSKIPQSRVCVLQGKLSNKRDISCFVIYVSIVLSTIKSKMELERVQNEISQLLIEMAVEDLIMKCQFVKVAEESMAKSRRHFMGLINTALDAVVDTEEEDSARSFLNQTKQFIVDLEKELPAEAHSNRNNSSLKI